MKVSLIQGSEATVKQSFSFKKSTVDKLQKYRELYKATTGVDVAAKDLVEQMLLDFMAEDKAFQKSLKKPVNDAAPPVAGGRVAELPSQPAVSPGF